MPDGRYLFAKDLAKSLSFSPEYIRRFAEFSVNRPGMNERPLLRHQSTGELITDKDGWAFAIVASPTGRRGRPSSKRGEHPWTFRRVEPPQPRVTAAQIYLLPGSPLGRDQKIIRAIAAAAGIMAADPVRVAIGARQEEPMQVVAADGPGPVLGMALRPEWRPGSWQTSKGDHLEVMVRGALLLPTAGPIGVGPGMYRLLWDPETHCWCGQPGEVRRLLELFGSAGLDHISDGSEPAVALINGDVGL